MALLDDLLPEVRIGASQMPDMSLVSALRRGAQRFLRESQVWAEDLEQFALVSGKAEYELQLPDGGRAERILVVTIDGRPIDCQMRHRELRAERQFDGMPTAWAVFDSQDEQQIGFNRTPRVAEAGKVVAVHASLSLTNDATELPDWIATDWHDGIVSATRAELFGQKGAPQYDPEAAAAARWSFSMDVARAKRVQVSGRHALLRAKPRSWV